MERLEPLSEDGEIKATSRAEGGESMRLKTFARGLTVTCELLINDDLGMLGDMTAALGEAAAQTEADELVKLLTSNPEMSDGTSVFDASRGNVGAAGLPSVDALTSTRQTMRTRKGMDGKTIIAVAPRYLLVSAALETEAEKVLASIQPNKSEDVNPFGGKLSLLVETRLPDDFWYVFADPARLAAMQYAYLSAAQGVQIQRTESWDTLGMKFRAFLDFGSGWLDWRPVSVMTLPELIARRDRLRRARFNGVATVKIDGEDVTYKTDAQIAAALTALGTEIAKLTRGTRSRKTYPQTTKGL